ncbi:MAG: DUF2934 domain-containing protein [Planctomycetota bacterium]
MASPKAKLSPAPSKSKSKTKTKTFAKKTAAKPVKKSAARKSVSAEERQRMIGEAAYYLAEKRGFEPGHHDVDWAAAERQIDALVRAR